MLLVALISILAAGQSPQAPQVANEPATLQGRQTQTTATPQQPQGAEVVCRRERIVGSNRSERVCTTVAQMDLREEAARRTMERHTSGAGLPDVQNPQ